MELSYDTVRTEVQELVKEETFPEDALKNLHRRVEVHNAYKTIENQEDKVMKDIEFFLRSAIFLMDFGNKRDNGEDKGHWKLQLEAALGILNKCP